MKRLAKENLKQLGRMVAKLAHANPMTVLRTIVNQVVLYHVEFCWGWGGGLADINIVYSSLLKIFFFKFSEFRLRLTET